MSRSLIAIPLCLAIAACSGEPAGEAADSRGTSAPAAGTAADPGVDEAPPVAAASQAQAAAMAALPPDMQPEADWRLVQELNYLTRTEARRRRTTFQVAGGATPSTVAEHIRASMVAAGYSERQADDPGDGMTRLRFGKAGVDRVNVRVRPEVEQPVLLDGATVEVFFDWLLEPAPDATGSGSSDPTRPPASPT